jgi:hypothetical protein
MQRSYWTYDSRGKKFVKNRTDQLTSWSYNPSTKRFVRDTDFSSLPQNIQQQIFEFSNFPVVNKKSKLYRNKIFKHGMKYSRPFRGEDKEFDAEFSRNTCKSFRKLISNPDFYIPIYAMGLYPLHLENNKIYGTQRQLLSWSRMLKELVHMDPQVKDKLKKRLINAERNCIRKDIDGSVRIPQRTKNNQNVMTGSDQRAAKDRRNIIVHFLRGTRSL